MLRFRNQRWAERVGLGALDAASGSATSRRSRRCRTTSREPLALRYHGHQFRVYNPQLGDGRGFLFAQLRDAADAGCSISATKGSGQTPWSRAGRRPPHARRAASREVLATEMLEALGVSTSKSFSLFETGEQLYRNDEPSPTRSSVLVRLEPLARPLRHASSATRISASRSCLRRLLDFAVRHYVAAALDVAGARRGRRRSCGGRAAQRAARRASWMVAGFVHGVLNTDNMNVTGESFDYGPYRFLPDVRSRRSPPRTSTRTGSTPSAGSRRWCGGTSSASPTRWRRSSTPRAPLEAALRPVPAGVRGARSPTAFCARLGLVLARSRRRRAPRRPVVRASSTRAGVGYDHFFFDWYGGGASAARALAEPGGAGVRAAALSHALRALLDAYAPLARASASRDAVLPAPASPCTLLIDEIEAIWAAIAERDDWRRSTPRSRRSAR